MQTPLSEGALYISISIYIYTYITQYDLDESTYTKKRKRDFVFTQKRDTPMHYITDDNAFLWSNDIEGEN